MIKVEAALALVLNEITQGAVIGAFSLDAEEAAGNLSFFPVVHDTLAAIAPLVAGGVGTSAVFEGF